MPAPINPSAPGAMPPRERQLLQKFGLEASATLLTTDRQSPKLRHGQALARLRDPLHAARPVPGRGDQP